MFAEYLLDEYEWTPGIDNRENEANDGKGAIAGHAGHSILMVRRRISTQRNPLNEAVNGLIRDQQTSNRASPVTSANDGIAYGKC